MREARAVATIDWGLCEQDFWRLTLADFLSLAKRHQFNIDRAFFPFACLMANQANLTPGMKQKFGPEDFMKKPTVKLTKGSVLGPEVAARFLDGAEPAK